MKRDLFGQPDRIVRLATLLKRAHGMTRDAIRPEIPNPTFFHRLRRENTLYRCFLNERRHERRAS